MSPISERSPETRFWKWFTETESQLFAFETNQERNTAGLLRELHRVNESLKGDKDHFDERVVGRIGFLLLDYTLGEYDVETLVGTVSFHPKEQSSGLTKLPLRDLPLAFDQLTISLSN